MPKNIQIDGSKTSLISFFRLLDRVDADFPIVTP